MDDILYVKCKKCGLTFPSGMAMDRKTFESATISGQQYECRYCGKKHTYEKADHFHQ